MVKFKNRYILAELIWEGNQNVIISKDNLFDSIKESIRENFGDYGCGVLFPYLQSEQY